MNTDGQRAGFAQRGCVDCGGAITIDPAVDGDTPWRCGRCAHTPLAQPAISTHAPHAHRTRITTTRPPTAEEWLALAEQLRATAAYVRQATRTVRRTRSSTTRITP